MTTLVVHHLKSSEFPEAAQVNARLYSVIETCKLHGHKPNAYLKHIFKVPSEATTV
ncbi:transposase domain-containing protein [Ketobacter sp. MCCC 1A13808]|uniref:transposase domain-containing protein n=1 Tax=Ketobacter sp. MCCC 1A13808 TaxID=2602738 RepID=UPI0012EB31A5|nr:transposase domain-containing protein [Ketobacter sp. MCCC 1A13808]MVF13323.1 transposase domain-containing protein [Ketobacter sp. MCCC 1A13808]